jgi:DNA polymerase-1
MCELGSDGGPLRSPVKVRDLPQAVAEYEQAGGDSIRWVWSSTAQLYPALLRAGVRVGRCHDVVLAAALLTSRDGAATGQVTSDAARADLTASAGAGWDRFAGEGFSAAGTDRAQGALFEPETRPPAEPAAQLDSVIAAHRSQLRAIAADEHPARFGALVAAESAGGLVAAEMSYAGMPWRADVHDELLTGLLGRRPPSHPPGVRPAKLAELAAEISAAFGGRPVNPDSPAQLVKAFAADGVRVPSTRFSVLREVEHPAVAPLVEYKELSRLYTAHGWAWLDTWVYGGRFKPEYVVGGVVSGRWASRGGGALQIPRVLRRAVVADPGWVLVVADAAQLEPRVLAALAGDRAFAAAAAGGDLYEALASVFGGDRGKAKIALLSAMYGGAGGEAGQLLAVLRRRFPAAAGYVEAAARAGEEGRVVRSVLGRSCPRPSAAWRAVTEESGDPDGERDPGAGRASRARGRFTRNFVVQASAADWALVLLAGLRSRLSASYSRLSASYSLNGGPTALPSSPGPPAGASAWGPHLVFFQHDEVIVHCPEALAEPVVTAVGEAADAAGRMVFGATEVRFPMTTAVVRCYADAK